jgi:VanZ family protein
MASLRQRLIIISLLIYWPAIFIVAHIPIPELVYKARVSDKSLHFLAYMVLVFLLWFAISPDRKVNWRKAAVWWVLLVVVWYGVLDELLQGYVGRMCDARDFVANLAGALASLILLSIFSFWSASLLVAGIGLFLLTNLCRANLADLLPITSLLFHLLAYGLFTMLWIRYMYLFLSLKAPQRKWLFGALSLPIAFLLTVKLFSVILDKNFSVQNVVISCVGIAVAVMAVYLTALFRLRSA